MFSLFRIICWNKWAYSTDSLTWLGLYFFCWTFSSSFFISPFISCATVLGKIYAFGQYVKKMYRTSRHCSAVLYGVLCRYGVRHLVKKKRIWIRNQTFSWKSKCPLKRQFDIMPPLIVMFYKNFRLKFVNLDPSFGNGFVPHCQIKCGRLVDKYGKSR